MPTVLYSTNCYIKNDLYRLSIEVDNNEKKSDDIPFEFTSTTINTDEIMPSLTRLKFELVNEKKNTDPKIIALNHLISIKQVQVSSNRDGDMLNSTYDLQNYSELVTSIAEESQQASQTTLKTQVSELTVPPTPNRGRQYKFRRMFSTQSFADTERNFAIKTAIHIYYVDVSNSIRWSIKKLKIGIENGDIISNELYTNLNLCLSSVKQRPRNLLAFVNPFGGKGRAKFVYEKKVLPIFKQANITVKSIYTERANHARDYVMSEDLKEYDGLICVGGDGMFAELCHGLLLRTSREAQLNIDDPKVNLVRPDIRIGIIPAGSTDAVVFGTTGLNDPVTSALQIIVGESLLIDIATVHNEKGFVRFMATMLAYGFFGDIIQQSDKWRCLGPLRYDLAGFWHFIRHRSYHTEITITLSPNDWPQTITPMTNISNETTPTTTRDRHQSLNNVGRIINAKRSSYHVIDRIVTPALVFCSKNCETCALEGPNSPHNHSSLKIKREGKYTTVNCLNMPGRCAKSKFGMSPFVHLGDGTFDLILVERSWHTSFLRFLWQVANDGRSIEDLPNVERYRASEVLIRPMHTDQKRLGNWAIDGELTTANELQVRVHRQALNLFASGIQFNELVEYVPIKKDTTKKSLGNIFKRKK